mgnify:CR=1 FL=1
MAFTEEQRLSVWNKATTVDGFDPKMFRKDACGAWINNKILSTNTNTAANNKLAHGPAAATLPISARGEGSRKGFTGTGLAQPKSGK